MTDLDKATASQLANLEVRTGKSLDELATIVRSSGLSKHGELVSMLKSSLGMGHGDANLLVHLARRNVDLRAENEEPPSLEAVLDTLYVGKRAGLRPVHEHLQQAMDGWGGFEWVPKKSYVSYRRKKQFAMIGPATNTQVEIGLNVKALPPSERLQAQPPGRMCDYRVRVGTVAEVDARLLDWLRLAWEAAG